MIETYLFALLWKSLLVVGAVGLALCATRRASAAVRSLILRSGMLLLLALPVLGALLPAWSLALLPAEPSAVVAVDAAGSVPASPPSFSLIAAIYALGVAIGLFRLIAALVAARLVVRDGISAERRRGFEVLLSEQAPMPFAYGHLRPKVLLPVAALDWERDLREDVISHEAAHIERRDWTWLVLSRVAAVVFWPNFAVAWMLHRLRIEAEVAADDLVLAGGQDGVVYAEHLVRVARACQSTVLLAPMAAEPPLTTRLRALLHGGTRRDAPGRASVHAAFALSMLVAAPLATLGFVPQRARPESGALEVTVAVTPSNVQIEAEVIDAVSPVEAVTSVDVTTAPAAPAQVVTAPRSPVAPRAPSAPRRWRSVRAPSPVQVVGTSIRRAPAAPKPLPNLTPKAVESPSATPIPPALPAAAVSPSGQATPVPVVTVEGTTGQVASEASVTTTSTTTEVRIEQTVAPRQRAGSQIVGSAGQQIRGSSQ